MTVLCITLNPAIDMTVSVDGLRVGEVNRALSSQSDAAGKGLNAAQILADLGIDTIASGFLGADNAAIFEQLFTDRQTMQGGSVQDGFVRVAGETRTNIKITDNSTTTDINGKGFLVSGADKQMLFKQLGDLAKECQAVLVAGSLPQGFDVGDFDKLLSALTAACDKVAVDVSGDALKVAFKHKLWLIKPNDDELFEVFHKPAKTLQEQRALIVDLDIDNVIVSMGSQGVNWFAGDKVYQATPPKMTVVSTVGAGDTLVAGMMAGLLQGLDDLNALARATALSAHAVSIVGFRAANDDELSRLLPQVEVRQAADD